MLSLEERIGNGLALGELTQNDFQNILMKLEKIRRYYQVLQKEKPRRMNIMHPKNWTVK